MQRIITKLFMEYIVLLVLIGGTPILQINGDTLDSCPLVDPNCHPTCIVYTVDHCRYCMCDKGSARGTSSSGFGSGSGMSADAAWDRGYEGGEWSNKVNTDSNAWSNSDGGVISSERFGSSSSGYSVNNKEESVRYVIVETVSEPRNSNSKYPSGISPLNSLSSLFPSRMASPFAGSHMPSALLPGTNTIPVSHSYGDNVIHVPLIAPGIPKYCVRCRILNCPESCERIDEYGCRSCPCAPSRYQTMPVMKDCSSSERAVTKPDCSATKLCMETCSDGYHLGDVGMDGCRSCTCIRRAPTTPKPETNGCPATLSCMLKCKDGYMLGEKQANGCPSCKCLAKGRGQNTAINSNNNFNNNNNNNNLNSNNNNFDINNYNSNNKWGDGGSKWNNNNAMSMNSGNTGNGNGNGGKGSGCSGTKTNYLTSTNGIGSGKCEPPMCFDGHMSVDQAMKIGSESAGGGGGCNEGGGSGVMDGGSMDGPSHSFTMNSGGLGSEVGGSGKGSGSIGSGGMGSSGMGMGKGSSGPSASGSGMPSPFSATMGGSGAGGMTMREGGGGGTGDGMPFSPFSSAMSGGGPGKGMSPGIGGTARGGMGSMGGMGSVLGTENSVSAAAYNKDCVGAECSAKNRMQHKECPDLVHCLVSCDGTYMLGQLDDAGCQTCSCTM